MTQPEMDKAPEMITYTLTAGAKQVVLEIPQTTILALEQPKRAAALAVLSRFAVAIRDNQTDTLEEDLAVVSSLEGMQLTLPGTERPVIIREFFGELMVSGSVEDALQYQSPVE